MRLAAAVQAGDIIQDQHNFAKQILSYSPIGQTFIAEDALISHIGFGLDDMNPQVGPIVPVNVELYEGLGSSATLLGSSPIEGLEPGFGEWPNPIEFFDADFSWATLTVGQDYTIILSTTSARAGVWGAEWVGVDGTILGPDPYPGGEGFDNQSSSTLAQHDLMFRVLPVPEPATLLMLGLGGFALLRKRRT